MSTDDTPAVDRESLFSAMTTMCKVLGMDQVTAESTAVEHIGMWFNEGILRDVREVQHEARQQICAAIEAITSSVDGDVEWLNREFVLAAIDDPDTKFLAAAMAYARAQERHEHGERIAKAQEGLYHADATADAAVGECVQLARDLSPAPDLGTPWTPPDGAFTDPDVHDPRDLSPAPEVKP